MLKSQNVIILKDQLVKFLNDVSGTYWSCPAV